MKTLFFALACLIASAAVAQSQPDYSNLGVTSRPDSRYANKLTLSATGLPDLTPWGLAGAPAPYHSLTWVFAEGDTARGDTATHIFSGKGTHEIQLLLCAKYSTSGPPPALRTDVTVADGTMASQSIPNRTLDATTNNYIGSTGSSSLAVTPGGENYFVVLYGNPAAHSQPNGRVLVFYNETDRRHTDFTYLSHHTYANEVFSQPSSSDLKTIRNSYPKTSDAWQLVDDAMSSYDNCLSWKSGSMAVSEQRALSVRFAVSNDSTKLLGNTLTYQTLWLPDSGEIKTGINEHTTNMLARESHDPNCISVSKRRCWWGKGGKAETLTYRVDFENTGSGPAGTIKISVELAKSLDCSTVELIESSHQKSASDQSNISHAINGNTLVWTLRDVYLPGARQTDLKHKNDTKGYIEFTLQTGGKRSSVAPAQAHIVFDKNPPISTNTVRTRFWRSQRYVVRAGALWHNHTNGNALAGPFTYGVGNVYAEVATSPARCGFIGRGYSAGFQLLRFEQEAVPATEPPTIENVQSLQLDVAPLQLIKPLGPFTVEAGIPLQVTLLEQQTVNGSTTSSSFSGFGAGGRLNLTFQPGIRGLFVGTEARYSYMTELGGRTDVTYLQLRAGIGWKF